MMSPKKLAVITIIAVVGFVFSTPADAYYHSGDIQQEETTTEPATTTTSPSESDIMLDSADSSDSSTADEKSTDETSEEGKKDGDSSNWIRVQQTWPGDTGTNSTDVDSGSDLQPETPSRELNPEPDPPGAEAVQYNETDFDLVTRLMESGGVNIAAGDVDAEGGDPDTPVVTGQVYNAIQVDGVKVRGWDPVQKEELESREFDVREVDTEVELALLAAQAVSADSNMEQVTLTYGKIEMQYFLPLRLFWLLNVEMPAEIIVAFEEGDSASSDDAGRVKVKLPWWHVLGRKTMSSSDIVSAYEKETAKGDAAELDTFTWISQSARAFVALSNILKADSDSKLNSIRNARS